MNILVIIISAILGATVTFYVSDKFKQSAVRSSALLSLIVGLIFHFSPEMFNAYLSKNIPLVFIGSSFIGMVSSKVQASYLRLAVAAILFSSVFINKSHFFEGFGGALGTLAFISLLTTMGVSDFLLRSTKIKRGMSMIRKKLCDHKS
jgi:uncharacterized membrane protein YqgA involved in biofilm formation